jgi:hypothetical protein
LLRAGYLEGGVPVKNLIQPSFRIVSAR